MGSNLDVCGIKAFATIGDVSGWNFALKNPEYIVIDLLKIVYEDKCVCQDALCIPICGRQELSKRRVCSSRCGIVDMKWNPLCLPIRCKR